MKQNGLAYWLLWWPKKIGVTFQRADVIAFREAFIREKASAFCE